MRAVASLVIVLFLLLTAPVAAQNYSGGATNYRDCDGNGLFGGKPPTLAALAECRADVAKQGLTNNLGINTGNQIAFNQPSYLDVRYFSFLSWVTLAINLGFIALLGYWSFLMVKAATKVIGSEGNKDAYVAAQKQMTAVLTSIAMMFVFLAILIFAGNFLGFGYIWEWPRAFSQCPNHNNKFYFTVSLENPGQQISCG